MREGLADYVPHVYRLTLRLTRNPHSAEDLTQETFLRAWQKRLQLKDERAVRVWLFRIAINLWKDKLRRSPFPKAAPHALTSVESLSETGPPPEREAETREDLEQAMKLLDSLPPRQRAVLYLAAVEDLSLTEVSEILQINRNAVKVNLSLARKRMREELAKLDDKSI